MAYTTIENPELYFQTKLFTGNATDDTAITLDGDEDMQPSLIWIKNRSTTDSHHLVSVPGTEVAKRLRTDTSGALGDQSDGVKSIQSDGFTIGTTGSLNGSGNSIVAWCWNAVTSFSNDASATSIGTIDSSGSVNTDAGISIVSYTGNSTSGASIKHGLSSAPKFVFGKAINTAGEDWFTGHASNGFDKYIKLNSTHAVQTYSGVFNDTAPNTSVVTLGSNGISNSSSYNYIMYCFADVKGFSKVGGSYTGNGNADGTFVYTGFRPAFIIFKRTDSTGAWVLKDNKRNTYNVATGYLYANASDAESTSYNVDFTANGVKLRGTDLQFNASGGTFIYMAFAEAPFVNSNGVPCNAR